MSTRALCAFAASRSGDRVAVVDEDGSLRLLSADGAEQGRWPLRPGVTALAWDWAGKWLAAGTADGWVVGWDLARSEVTSSVKVADAQVVRLLAHLDGPVLCLVEGAREIVRLNVLAGERLEAVPADVALTGIGTCDDPDASRAITQDNWADPWNALLAARADGTLQDLSCRSIVLPFERVPLGPLATNGAAACVGQGPDIVHVELFGSNNRSVLSGHEAAVTHLSWTRTLVSADARGAVKVWRPHTCECLHTLELGSPTVGLALRDRAVLAAGRDGRIVRFALPEGGELNFLAAAAGVRVSGGFRGGVSITRGGGTPVRHASANTWRSWYSVTEDARLLACRGTPGTVELWDLEAGRAELLSLGTDEEPAELALDPGGRFLCVPISRDESTRCFRLPGKASPEQLAGGFRAVVSPDGARVATAGYRAARLRLFDSKTGKRLWEQRVGEPAFTLRFTGDGRGLLAEVGDALVAFDSASGRELWRCPVPRRSVPIDAVMHPNRLAGWTPLGADRVVLAQAGTAVRILDAGTGAELARGPVLESLPSVATHLGGLAAVGTLGQRVVVLDEEGGVRLDVKLEETPVALAFGGESLLNAATSSGRELGIEVPLKAGQAPGRLLEARVTNAST